MGFLHVHFLQMPKGTSAAFAMAMARSAKRWRVFSMSAHSPQVFQFQSIQSQIKCPPNSEGYHDIIALPVGATAILVEELRPTSNVFGGNSIEVSFPNYINQQLKMGLAISW